MPDDMLLWDQTIFRDETIFELDHIPENFIHRDNQLQSLIFNMRPALRGVRPINTLCLGHPATGKTTAVLKIFEEIEKQTSSVLGVYINCQVTSSRFKVFSQIYKRVFGHAPPASGISFEKLFDKIAKHLEEEEKVVIVALDDINYLFYENEVSKVLYSILRVHEVHPGVKIGVIGILSDLDLHYSLDPRVDSVFRPDEIHFPLYARKEILEILRGRVKLGFYANVIADDLLEYVVDKVEEAGDLRMGIDLLRRGGLNAERRASKTVSLEDIEKAYDKSGVARLVQSVKSLKSEEKVILKILGQSGETKAGELYKIFKEDTSLGYTTFHEMLGRLDGLRLININFTGEGERGRSRVITLRCDEKELMDLL
ncbi:MAG: ORC1-type DNA replication protein [Halobacteriota archaeon]|nr:ORC1-type DNA replication protein [Halobacteriota archaeon]